MEWLNELAQNREAPLFVLLQSKQDKTYLGIIKLCGADLLSANAVSGNLPTGKVLHGLHGYIFHQAPSPGRSSSASQFPIA